jgi:uncharacterized metal-binding protein
MEALLALFVPLVLLWVGFSLISGRSLSPDAVLRSTAKLSWQILRWLWRDRRQKGGGGRVKRPPIRYRR